MNAKIISVERAFVEGVTAEALTDIANWHAEKADAARRSGHAAEAARHTNIEDRLVARAAQIKRAAHTEQRSAA